MKKSFIILFGLVTILVFASCSNNDMGTDENTIAETEDEILGTSDFILGIKQILGSSLTRSVDEEEAIVVNLIEESKVYLTKNGINYSDIFPEESDARIAVLAMGIAEYDKQGMPSSTRTSLGGCVLEAIGVKDLGKAGAKYIAKEVGKAVLKKAVPYIGWGLFAVDMAMCLSE